MDGQGNTVRPAPPTATVGWASPTATVGRAPPAILPAATLPEHHAFTRVAGVGMNYPPDPYARHVKARHRRRGAPDLRRRIVQASVVILSLIVSAGLLSMEVGSRSHPWLGWLTLVPLLAAVRLLSPAKALACGALWGSSLLLFMVSSVEPLVPATILSFALLTVVPGAYAYLAARLTRRFGFNPLILGFAWAGVELALIPLGLEGGLLVSMYGHEAGFLHFLEGVLGYVCLAAFIAAVNGLLLSILSRACVRGWGSRRRYVSGSIKTERRFFPLEVPHYPFLCYSQAQPRAPPI